MVQKLKVTLNKSKYSVFITGSRRYSKRRTVKKQ